MTPLPVIGVPVKTSALSGVDSLYSIVQMPRGVPVATVAIGNATNAGLLGKRRGSYPTLWPAARRLTVVLLLWVALMVVSGEDSRCGAAAPCSGRYGGIPGRVQNQSRSHSRACGEYGLEGLPQQCSCTQVKSCHVGVPEHHFICATGREAFLWGFSMARFATCSIYSISGDGDCWFPPTRH